MAHASAWLAALTVAGLVFVGALPLAAAQSGPRLARGALSETNDAAATDTGPRADAVLPGSPTGSPGDAVVLVHQIPRICRGCDPGTWVGD